MAKNPLRLLVPKGHIQASVVRLLSKIGVEIGVDERSYRPICSDSDIEIKLIRPQNIAELIALGRHDAGFTGYDWIVETRCKRKIALLSDTGLDRVRVVAAAPKGMRNWRKQVSVVATEYVNLAKDFLKKEGLRAEVLRTHGSTEVYPPEDADMIIDVVQTGTTLREHNLREVATVMESTTLFIASPSALKDPSKRRKLDDMVTLIDSVLRAEKMVLVEMNASADVIDELVENLPAMKSPTLAPLLGGEGYAVKIAVKREEVSKLLPKLRERGATDILVYPLEKLLP